MAMTIVIDCLTGAGPTVTAASAIVFSREDSVIGTTGIPVPTATGTKFSWAKTMQLEITATGGLTMSNILVGKVTNESVAGTKLWEVTSHAVGAYVQASSAPGDTADNNVTAPTVNGAAAAAVQLISTPPSTYAAGPFNTTGRKGNLVELVAGLDNTCVSSGTGIASPTMRWKWTEA